MNKAAREILQDREELTRLYQFFSQRDLSRLFDCTHHMVKAAFKRLAVDTRGYGSRPPLKESPAATLERARLAELGIGRLDARSQVEVSTWRLHVLRGLCPFTCPYTLDCSMNQDKCPLRDALAEQGALEPRPWEPRE